MGEPAAKSKSSLLGQPVAPRSASQAPQSAIKRIKLRGQLPEEAAEILKAHSLSEVSARILAARGFKNDDTLRNFISPALKTGLPAPSGLKNLEAGAQLLADTVAAGQSIAIACDFDVDGLSGGAQVYHFLRTAGARVAIFVPDRFTDGYGLNCNMIEKMAAEKFSTLLTIDFGTTNATELKLAHSLGMKTVVVDHHHVGDHQPSADVFINPKQQGCGFAGEILCAAGLAWYLVMALQKKLPGAKDLEVKSYLDLACLGTICDMVPLIGANRVLAKRGLEQLDRTSRVGLRSLIEQAAIRGPLGCSDVSFGIGPRLNAAGRMVHGEIVIELLTTSDMGKASKIARKLNKLNAERQEIEARIKDRAIQQILRMSELPWGIAVWGEDYHTGVIGIVAQRVVEHFYRPTAVMGFDSAGIYKGSVRGIKGFSVVEALGAVQQHLIKFGGHDGAGGFSVAEKDLPAFSEAFNAECKARLSSIETEPVIEADTEAALSEISVDLVRELAAFSPFGVGNPAPQLLVRNLEVVEVRELKGAHLKAVLRSGKQCIAGLLWRHTSHPALEVGNRVDIVGRPDTNSYNGTTALQITLSAIDQAR